ncbi:hypothetical protein BD779DRAFT_1671122 [Infundibulicybe gibba]|nr:hypothetical protein BD779DRAFT_1671122 [Infundibulicybe gibba]
MKEYYTQRASTPGSLLITEATLIAAQAGGYVNVPGIWSQPQIDAWKQVRFDFKFTSRILHFLQLWALGRTANPDTLAAEDPSFPYISASNLKLSSSPASEPAPRALTIPEIDEYIALYAQAARNAIAAGFDGVEIHGATGYLVDQFLQDVSNIRDDEYGGSIENRSRFALRVVDAIADAVGADRTALRLSPWSSFQDMGMSDPVPQFTHLISTLAHTHTDLAYIHLVESRAEIGDDASVAHKSNAPSAQPGLRVGSSPLPDLPMRLRKDIPLTPYDRKTFYVPVDQPGSAHGYVDYPFAEEGRL